MNTKDFFQFYDLKEMEVLSISNQGEDVVILFNADVEMELMANGFRGGFDLSFCQQATFQNVHLIKEYQGPLHIDGYFYEDDQLVLQLGKERIMIPNTQVVVHRIKTVRV